MRCIVCSHGNLEIVNSRKHPSELRVWRRRKCSQCDTLITTKELPDYDRTFSIQTGKRKNARLPFEKAALIAQLFAAGGHIKKQQDLLWLAETIATKAFMRAAGQRFSISSSDYRSIALGTLGAYDKLLSANFEARYPA